VFERQLMPEDILHLRALSMSIMQDPVCELRSEEVDRFVKRHPDPLEELPVWHPERIVQTVTQTGRKRQLAVSRFADLMLERLDDDELCKTFNIDRGFNKRAYFMILHLWLLHQRLILEGPNAKSLDTDLFSTAWDILKQWMMLKKVPEYRFGAELRNVQEHMLGCCVALDNALERPDILPARLQQTLWANVYSGEGKKDAEVLTHLTKYLLRQLGLMLQLDAEVFLNADFVWADFDTKS